MFMHLLVGIHMEMLLTVQIRFWWYYLKAQKTLRSVDTVYVYIVIKTGQKDVYLDQTPFTK